MILEHGDMWSIFNQTDLFCITTNREITTKGELIMGAGIAKQAKERFPELPSHVVNLYGRDEWDESILKKRDRLQTTVFAGTPIGFFHTKHKWREPSTLKLIEESTLKLFKYILENKPGRVDLNFPGIGKGGLDPIRVLEIICYLPDNVHVWRNDHSLLSFGAFYQVEQILDWEISPEHGLLSTIEFYEEDQWMI